MFADPVLDSLETDIRAAVASDSFGRAKSLLERYPAEVERCARHADSQTARFLQARVEGLLGWTCMMIRASRDRAAGDLLRLQRVRAFTD